MDQIEVFEVRRLSAVLAGAALELDELLKVDPTLASAGAEGRYLTLRQAVSAAFQCWQDGTASRVNVH